MKGYIKLTREKQADYILYTCGLLEELNKLGKSHITGSYRMDMMAWNDLDIDVENENMTLDKLYLLSNFIMERFHPTWYEAKEELNKDGKTVWFHGFETIVDGQLWNIDIWFFDKETISKALLLCDKIVLQAGQISNAKDNIVEIKKELIQRQLYAFDKYTSMDVYKAVLNQHISNVDEFLSSYIKQ